MRDTGEVLTHLDLSKSSTKLLAIVANMAGYSFLSHSMEGDKVGGAGEQVVGYAIEQFVGKPFRNNSEHKIRSWIS